MRMGLQQANTFNDDFREDTEQMVYYTIRLETHLPSRSVLDFVLLNIIGFKMD